MATNAFHTQVMKVATSLLIGLLLDKRAVTSLEYGLIAALIAVAIISGVTTLGSHLNKTLADVATKINY